MIDSNSERGTEWVLLLAVPSCITHLPRAMEAPEATTSEPPSSSGASAPVDELHAALWYAIGDNQGMDVVRELLAKGADVNRFGSSGEHRNFTALHLACATDRSADMVQLLLDHGAEKDVLSASGATALTLACANNNEALVRLLITAKASVNAGREALALSNAASHGSVTIVRELLEHHAEVNTVGPDACTALHRAVLSGHPQGIRSSGLAARCPYELIDTYARRTRTSCYPLDCIGSDRIGLAWMDWRSVAALLLEHKADVHLKAKHQASPLHFAAGSGVLESVELLLKHQADVNQISAGNTTPLHLAAYQGGNLDVVRVLLDAKANPSIESTV